MSDGQEPKLKIIALLPIAHRTSEFRTLLTLVNPMKGFAP